MRPRRRGVLLLVQTPDGDAPTAVPGWAISLLSLLLGLSLLGLGVFGAYHYLRAQRLAAQIESLQPDPRTRELHRAILDQQGRVRSLEDDYTALTRQVAEHQSRVEAEVERLSGALRELERFAGEVRKLLDSPMPLPPSPVPTPGAETIAPPQSFLSWPERDTGSASLSVLTPGGGGRGGEGNALLWPQDIAFPAIDPDPHNVGLRLNLVRAQLTLRRATLQGLQAELIARRATVAAEVERAQAEAEVARLATQAAARAQAEAEAQIALAEAQQAQADAEAAARRTRSLDPQLAQLDNQVEGIITRLRNGEPVAPQPRQLLSIPLPTQGPGAPARWPLKSVVSSPFGYRTFRGQLDWHTGVDLTADLNTDIRATQGGVVVFAGWQAGYGWCVEIGHGSGYSTLYAHMARLLVDTGDTVEANTVLGLSGSSGNSTGPHLHYEVRLNGKAVDPTPYLP